MEEGERLSIKQSNMETTIKKLRGQVKELEASHTQTAAKLAAEEAKIEAATQARHKAEAAAAAALQQHKADAEQQKQHFGNLLKEAHKSQVRLHSGQGLVAVNMSFCMSGVTDASQLLLCMTCCCMSTLIVMMTLYSFTGRPACYTADPMLSNASPSKYLCVLR